MAFVVLLPEGNRAGQNQTTPGLPMPAGAARVIFRILAANWQPGTGFMTFALDTSPDGVNWTEAAGGTVTEGALNRDGTNYQKSLSVDDLPAGSQVRARYSITRSMRFGIEWDVVDLAGNSLLQGG